MTKTERDRRHGMSEQVVIVYIMVNACVFFLYGVDKIKAQRGSYRIPEKTLLLLGLAGPYGAFLGMQGFRHKTKKTKFRLLIPLMCISHLLLLALFMYLIKIRFA